ncbi:ribonucleoside-diphosphate reductase, adenosylcobalamin-dependent [Gloeobacter kilaueensis JS1]|uniref:Vitamin B12-dependent ribonucleotide reductase n=2 Tax=Gloeobacter TaxID=33071 RepID=U5QCA1_GLOK1|nr:ribonucleoside-diphosphate reductase, adenosylcobalamin-dependent [Gloeobacter kilaueensis JS1]
MAMDGAGSLEQQMVLSEAQKAVLQKYLVADEHSWEEVCRRVSRFVASAEKTPELQREWEQKFYSVLAPMKMIPGGSILANSDHGTHGLLNCFVLSAEDNIQDIAKLVTDAILTTKFRGGVGINIGAEGQKGYIRPKGFPFADGKALGPCAVLDMISETSKKITTGNKSRRGAFMFSMHWKHPDVQEFVQAKTQSVMDAQAARQLLEQMAELVVDRSLSDEQKNARLAQIRSELGTAWKETHLSPQGTRDRRWHNANISVQVDDEFFERLDAGDPAVVELWDKIAEFAHDTADPGLLLSDNARRRSPLRNFITTTNPCGEIWLPPNSACNLGSIVISRFVYHTEQGAQLDWDDLGRTIEISTRFLDDVLDVAEFATPAQKHNVRQVFRQLGLGIMGWADWLKVRRIPYDSQLHLQEIDRVGRFIAERAYRASEALAAEKGTCGIWDAIKDVRTGNPFERWTDAAGNFYSGDEAARVNLPLTQMPRRNSTVLSIAPTGSIAQLAACSWAFEPDFGLTIWKQVYVDASRSQQNWVQILSPYVEDLHLSEADRDLVLKTGSLQGTAFALAQPEEAAAFKISREIPWQWHVLAQGRWQQWVDSSISKTINCSGETTVEEIKEMYRFAERNGLKGITVYREGTLESEPVKIGAIEDDKPAIILPTQISNNGNGNGNDPMLPRPFLAGDVRPAMLDEEVSQAASLIGIHYDDGPMYLSEQAPIDDWTSSEFKGGCGGGVLHYQIWRRENGRRLLVVRSDSYSQCFIKN